MVFGKSHSLVVEIMKYNSLHISLSHLCYGPVQIKTLFPAHLKNNCFTLSLA